MPTDRIGTEELLEGAAKADRSALSRLLDRHRLRLRRMLAARLDRRLSARVDPSDIVQETLTDASRRLPEYLRERPVPYWTWLRRLAIQRMIWWRRAHLVSKKRTFAREQPLDPSPSDHENARLVDRLIGSGTSPSAHAVRNEERAWAQAALEQIGPADRQILELRYFEDLSFAEIAARLELGVSAVKMRHLRAAERFRELLGEGGREAKP